MNVIINSYHPSAVEFYALFSKVSHSYTCAVHDCTIQLYIHVHVHLIILNLFTPVNEFVYFYNEAQFHY